MALAIDLTSPNEVVTFHTDGTTITAVLTGGTATDGGGTTAGNVSGFGSSTVQITSAAFNVILVADLSSGNSASFADSSGNYPQIFAITLNDPASGNVTFSGDSTFTANFNAATTAGFVASAPDSSLTLTGASNLSITATGHDVLLKGAVSVGGTTAIAANVIDVDNAANDFTGAFQLTGPTVAKVHDINDLNLGATSLAFGGLGQTTHITAGGNITQSGVLNATVGGLPATLDLSSSGGSITLTNAGNSVAANVALSLSVTGTNTITFTNSPAGNSALTLGDVQLGTGALSITSNGTITQRTDTTVETGGAVTLTVASNNRDILLSNGGNRIAGAVIVAESSAGFLRDVTVHNADDHAAAPTGAALTTAGNVRNLTLIFDHNGVALPAYNISNNLSVTTGGDITQTGPETITGASTFTVAGDHTIDLSNPANAFTGSVSFNTPQATQPLHIVNAGALALGTSNLGRGTFSVTAVAGDITAAGIVQEKGAAPATFTVLSGTSINLVNSSNRLTSNLIFAGPGLTTVGVRNSDSTASFAKLTIPGTVNTLTVRFDNVAAAVPSLGTVGTPLTSLTVIAPGIVQQLGSAINATTANFNSLGFAMDLSNAGNDFTNLTVSTSGRNDVTIADLDDLNFTGTSTLGSGRLTVTAGAITDSGTITQSATGPAGDVSFTSSGNIILDAGHGFRGPVSVKVTGSNAASIVNAGVTLTLGPVITGTGSFSAAAGTEGIVQDVNSILTLGGTSSFTAAAGAIDVSNQTNTFTGAVALSGTNVSLRAVGPVLLAASNVSTALSVQTGGAGSDAITQSGPITGNSTATFDVGAANVTLTDAANNFTKVSVFSTGSAVSITDTNALTIGTFQLGSGTLNLKTGGNLNSGVIVQASGTGTITLDTPAGSNIAQGNSANVLRGTVNIVHATDVNLRSKMDVTFSSGSVVTGSLIATAGGVITLPNDLTALDALTLSANSTTISSDVTVTGGTIDVTGELMLTGDRIITTTAGTVTFRNGVNVGGALTFNLPASGTILQPDGDWNQGSNPLSINGAGVGLNIGGGGRANFNMTSGTISMLGGGDVNVFANATLRIGATSAAETVTLANGSGDLIIGANAVLEVGFGTTNDQLIKTGSGPVTLTAGARLLGSGLAGPSASPVLVSQTALLNGRFAESVDAGDVPRDFFAGSDIVTPGYDFTQVTVKSGGLLAPSGTISGFLPDGDHYTVSSSLGAASGLAIVEDLTGALDVVVRNNTATGASKLTITTSGGGDGRLPINGVMVHTPGGVSIIASSSDFTGSLTTAGTLTSLLARDLGVTDSFVLTGGGPATAKTSITAHEVTKTTIVLTDALDKFKAVSVTNNSRFTADKFGTLTTTGDAKGSNANGPGIPNLGDFNANLTSTTAATGMVVGSATIAGALGGTWDVRGSIGKVVAGSANTWVAGVVPSSLAHSGGLLTDVKTLSFGFITGSTINASGLLGALTSSDIVGSSTLNAGSFGALIVKPNLALGLAGNVTSLNLTASGNTGGVALKSFTVAGDLSSSKLTFLDGDATSIVVARTISSTTIGGTDVNGHGNLKTLSAGRWQNSALTGRTIGTLKSTGNLAAGIFGDFTNSSVTLSGNTAGIALKLFDARGNATDSSFDIQSGNVPSFVVGRQFASTVTLSDPAFGILGTIQAGDWGPGGNVLAKTIATVASVGAPAAGPASPLLLGGIAGSTITAYQNSGTAAAITKLNIKGDLSNSTVNAEHGIGSVAVGLSVTGSFIVADDATTGALSVGRILTLAAGAWSGSSISVNTFGAVKITGFPLPESTSASFTFGDVINSTFLVHGATPTKPTGVDSFTVARHLQSNVTLVAPFGIKTLSVGGSISSTQVIVDNPANPASGFLTSLTAGDLSNSTVRAGSIGTLKISGSLPFARLGDVDSSTISVTSGATISGGLQAIGTLTVAGDFHNSVLDAAATVGKIEILGGVTTIGGSTRIQAGYATGSKLGSFTAGAFGTAGSSVTTDLVSQSVGTFTLKGNASRGFVGTTDHGFVDILGNVAGLGLGTFSATGTATDSLFRVSDGDVTSFTVQRLASTDLLVGFRFDKASDLTTAATTAQWSATNHKIGAFKTTAPFDATEASDSASFVDSNVIAGILGSITISGVNPDTINATAFGVAFRTSAGATASGVVKTNGLATALTAPASNGQFNYLGLAG